MSHSPDSGLFPWEDEPPIPAEIAPDDAAEPMHRDDFGEPDAPGDVTAQDGAEIPTGDAAETPEDAAEAQGDAAEAPAARRTEHTRPLVRKEYYAISEVSDLVGLPAHVLRYWESQFSVLNPSKNRSGNRVYQRKEIRLILLVKQLLYEDKYTVEGAKQKLDQLRRGGALQEATTHALTEQMIGTLRDELRALSELLAPDAG